MVLASLKRGSLGYCFITFSLNGKVCNDVKFCALNNLSVDLILDIGLKSAYHQIPIHEDDKAYTNVCMILIVCYLA